MKTQLARRNRAAALALAVPLEVRRLFAGLAASFAAPTDYDVGGFNDGVIIADLNGDRSPDVVAATSDASDPGTVSVLINNGDGTFKPSKAYAVGDFPVDPVAVDLNSDEVPDLAVLNEDDGTVGVLIGNGDGTFKPENTYPTDKEASAMAVGNFNNDGTPDVITANEDGTVSVLLGTGMGTFDSPINTKVGGDLDLIAVADINGREDAVVDNEATSTAVVLLGNGNGTFKIGNSYPVGPETTGIVLADLNGDGILDLITSDFQTDSVSIRLGNGDGTFGPAKSYAAGREIEDVQVADVNGDSIPDLITTNSIGTVSILRGNGDGTFAPAETFRADLDPDGVAIGDVSGDGRPDIVTASNENDVAVQFGLQLLHPVKLLEPAAHATGQSNRPTFSWSDPDHRAPYRVLVSTDPATLPTDPSSTANVPGAAVDIEPFDNPFTSTALLRHGTTYYWEVQHNQDDDGDVSDWSAVRSFTTAPDVAPKIKPLAAAKIIAGQTYAAIGSFTDPDVGDTWTATVNYGDGSGKHTLALNSKNRFELSHTYKKAGTFSAIVVVTDNSGESSTDHISITVAAPKPAIALAEVITAPIAAPALADTAMPHHRATRARPAVFSSGTV